MISAEAIQKVVDLAKAADGKTVQIEDVVYATLPLHDVRKKSPVAEPLVVHTLQGLVDYLKAELDAGQWLGLALHVASEASVTVLSALQGHFRQREVYATATLEGLFDHPFKWGQFYSSEGFHVALQACFVDTEARRAVLKLVGNIKEEQVRTSADDGVTQTVTARAGIAKSEFIEVPNPVTLKPFRTFREIDQPESTFVLRLRSAKEGEMPTCALFEADGSAWRLEAIKRIRDWLHVALPGSTIIG